MNPKDDIPQGTWVRSVYEFPTLPPSIRNQAFEQVLNNRPRRVRPDRVAITTDVRADTGAIRTQLVVSGRQVRVDGTVSPRHEHLIYDDHGEDRALANAPSFALELASGVLAIIESSPVYEAHSQYQGSVA